MKTYAISEAVTITGLPESTLRYYERIGLIERIQRDESSRHRTYTQGDLDRITVIACLSATGMSIADMRSYMENRDEGAGKAREQADLLTQQKQQIEHEIEHLRLRMRYVEAKISYWQAVENGDPTAIAVCSAATNAIADEMNLPGTQRRIG